MGLQSQTRLSPSLGGVDMKGVCLSLWVQTCRKKNLDDDGVSRSAVLSESKWMCRDAPQVKRGGGGSHGDHVRWLVLRFFSQLCVNLSVSWESGIQPSLGLEVLAPPIFFAPCCLWKWYSFYNLCAFFVGRGSNLSSQLFLLILFSCQHLH